MSLPHPTNLLEAWPQDREPDRCPSSNHEKAFFDRFLKEALEALPALKEGIRSAKHEDPQEDFDALYRTSHTLLGFARILKLHKLEHLFGLLDFSLDQARIGREFHLHSLGYVANLTLDTALSVLRELGEHGRCETNTEAVVSECAMYLREPFRQRLAKHPKGEVRKVEQDRFVDEAGADGDAPGVDGDALGVDGDAPGVDGDAPGVEGDASGVDDKPETLDIPVDRIGLVSDFCEESRENLSQMGRLLIDLETTEEPTSLVNQLFRSVHTIKGGARLLNVGKIETLTHELESLLDEVRSGTRSIDSDLIDLFLDAQRTVEAMVDEVATRGPITTRIAPVLQALANLRKGEKPAATAGSVSSPKLAMESQTSQDPAPRLAPAEKPASSSEAPAKATGATAPKSTESIRIATDKLDDVLNTASEIFISRLRLQNDVRSMKTALNHFKQSLRRMSTLSPEAIVSRIEAENRHLKGELLQLMARPDRQMDEERLTGLIEGCQRDLQREMKGKGFSSFEEFTLNILSIEEIRKRFQKNIEHLEQLSSRLQHGAMGFRMVPVASLFDRFPTQVRDLARQVGKKVKLEVEGAETELDKILVFQLADPLLHILRNSVDHGIEETERRAELGKPEIGRIRIRAFYHGSHAVIEVEDDGQGIDVEKVRRKAVERGLIEEDASKSMETQEILAIIFEPGFSTVSKVSELSGRGVGMDVVKTAISQVQGTISLQSRPGEGTVVRMKLPLTLAVVGTVLVEEHSHQFAVPILHVDEILTVKKSEIKQFSNNTVYNHRGKALPLTTLSSVFGFEPSLFASDDVSLVILAEGDTKIGILVDAILGRQEVLIKNLGSLVKKVPFVMGSTILSDSRLVLILNAWEVVNFTEKVPLIRSLSGPSRHHNRRAHTILVVDDSAIQRKNLQSMIRQAGYAVETANNGFEALSQARRKSYAAFCVDVVMPLMDGFEFVERLRSLPQFAEVPVFFVTKRTSQAEKDRASQLGVREYFDKPVDAELLIESFDAVCLGPGELDEEASGVKDDGSLAVNRAE